MSWSIKVEGCLYEDFEDELFRARELISIEDNLARAQATQAMITLQKLITSKTIVQPGQKITAYLSGHAHSDNDDFAIKNQIAISVYGI